MTRPDFERIESIPFAFKYENVCWVGLYKDKNTEISVTKGITSIYIRFVAAFFFLLVVASFFPHSPNKFIKELILKGTLNLGKQIYEESVSFVKHLVYTEKKKASHPKKI